MIRKLLPVFLAILGLGLGVGGGYLLRPKAEIAAEAPAAGEGHASAPAEGAAAPAEGEAPEYVKLANQFVVPLITAGKVGSMVILSLSLEVTAGSSTLVYSGEPKLRDAFLQVLFDHANAGGFAGNFTEGTKMQVLRNALLETAVKVMGPIVTNVLIDDIVRQDT